MVFYSRADGTSLVPINAVLLTGNQTIAGVKTFSSQPIVPAQSSVRVNTPLGYGSTNTSVRRFTNTVLNQGSDITYADSATLGGTFTVNTNGTYAISYSDAYNAAGDMYITVNSTTLTVAPTVLTQILSETTTAASATRSTCSSTVPLNSGDVIRAQGTTAGVSRGYFTVTRVA